MKLQQAEHMVMLVDDEEGILNALSRLLRKERYTILSAETGVHALTLMAQHPVDVVVSDQQMPGMTGVEFLKEVKDRYPETIRILLTGYADMNVAISAINEGEVYRFITKPWQDEELKLEIRHALMQHDLLKENKLLVQAVRKRDTMLAELEKEHPGISARRESAGALAIEEEDGISLEGLILKYFPAQEAADRQAAETS